jgi:hypothetical protein
VSPKDIGIALLFASGIDKTRDLLRQTASRNHDPLDIARRIPFRSRRKYDWLLADDLTDEEAARGWIDLPGAMAILSASETSG